MKRQEIGSGKWFTGSVQFSCRVVVCSRPFILSRQYLDRMAPVTRKSDEDSRGEKMTGADEAFPYEMLTIEANQQKHYSAAKTITEKRRQRGRRAVKVMEKLSEVISDSDREEGKLDQAVIDKSIEMAEEVIADIKDKTGTVLSQIDVLKQIVYGELRKHKEEAKVDENLDVMIESEHEERDRLVGEIRDIMKTSKAGPRGRRRPCRTRKTPTPRYALIRTLTLPFSLA